MSNNEQSEQIAGNIQTAIFTSEDNGFQSIKYFFTYHIQDDEVFEQGFKRLENMKDLCSKYIWGEEYGKSGDTPHIQGAFILKSKMRAQTIGNHFFKNGVTLRKLKNWDAAFKYCQKECNEIHTNMKIKKPIQTIQNLFQWQQEIVDIVKVEPEWDCRKIYWYYGEAGMGKSQLAKYLKVHHDATILDGSQAHMLAQAQNSDSDIFIILLSYGDDIVSYRAIEKIKDGLWCSHFGTDNNKDTVRNAPHIIVIGNLPPDESDRHFHPGKYIVKEVVNDKVVNNEKSSDDEQWDSD